MLYKNVSKNTVKIRIAWDLAFYLVAGSINEMVDKSLNILQIANLLNSENDEMIPLACMTILKMPSNTPEKVRC